MDLLGKERGDLERRCAGLQQALDDLDTLPHPGDGHRPNPCGCEGNYEIS